MDRPAVRDAALFLLRVVVGVVFVAHGYDRLFLTGMAETTAVLAGEGVPQPPFAVWLMVTIELIGGALLVLGLLTTYVAGVLLVLVAAGIYFVHLDGGFFVADGGFEYALVLVAVLIVVIVFGPGRASLDGVLTRD